MIKNNGFSSPNHTQTPNDFFDLLPDMEDSELRVTLVMIRNTFGFHRAGFKMSVGKLAAAAGLSENGAKAGAKAAEERGTFYRVNPDSIKEAEWALVVDGSPADGSTIDPPTVDPLPGQPVTPKGSTSDPHSPLQIKKESKRKKGDIIDGILQTASPKELLEKEATTAFEEALGFEGLPWWGKSSWDKLRRFVVKLYQEDPTAFKKYADWRNDPKGGMYKGMTNKQIRLTPDMFIDTGWAEFAKVHKPAAEQKPVITRASDTKKTTFQDLPEELQKKILATRERLAAAAGRMAGDDPQTA